MSERIPISLIKRLLERPETGMGYQILEATLKPDWKGHLLVLNAELALEAKEHGIFVAKAVRPEVESRLLKAVREAPEQIDFRVLSGRETVQKGLVGMQAARAAGAPADQAEPEMSKAEEKFLRYSAFANDRRINSDGSVVPNTYATTYWDVTLNVKTGMDAVRRYALPNPKPAVHRFELEPPSPVQIRRGTVAPAHGQPGGGEEVIFDNGAPAGTLRGQTQIPPGT